MMLGLSQFKIIALLKVLKLFCGKKESYLGEETLHRDTTVSAQLAIVTSPECRDASADLHSLRAPDLSSSGSEAATNVGDTCCGI